MRRTFRLKLAAPAKLAALAGCLAAGFVAAAPVTPALAGQYKNFRVAVYCVVDATQRFADEKVLKAEFDRVMARVKFDKVYLEVYRDRRFADEATLDKIKKFFTDRGIVVEGGLTLSAGGGGGQFGTFDYEKRADRDECKKAVQLAARHFDTVILDDFFFYTSKSDADIAAKGARSWTEYRLETMRKVSTDLVLKPARAINPKIKMIIKYPNWYEHFQGLGYDLQKQSHWFDGIYTGTETRDPTATDQLLQQYQSYEIVRYFDNVRPGGGNGGLGGNLGGWVDTFSVRYADRYAEQLWDTLFAKAPEITLFSWHGMAALETLEPGERDAWKQKPTSFNWEAMARSYQPPAGESAAPNWGRVAGWSLEQIDRSLDKLGNPLGVKSYKPTQSSGEDYLHDYLGNIGVPIELVPEFPTNADIVLLTESAKRDPDIVAKMKKQLASGKNVMVTSGLLRALQDRGIKDIAEAEETGRVVSIRDFASGFGAGRGQSLNDPKQNNPAVLFPEIRFFTNDTWAVVRGVAGAKGFPIVLMNHYSKGIFYVLTVPENVADLYSLPPGVTSAIKSYLQQDFPVRIESPPEVALYAYDNGAFVVESFRRDDSEVTVSVVGEHVKLKNAMTGEAPKELVQTADPGETRRLRDGLAGPARTRFKIAVPPHSYLVFAPEKTTN
ncbi:MAG TPA: hypothetical protein VLC06_24755 [Polyangia bacterium]|nr:hypothetical protein [Polyangia bacterium]